MIIILAVWKEFYFHHVRICRFKHKLAIDLIIYALPFELDISNLLLPLLIFWHEFLSWFTSGSPPAVVWGEVP